MSDSSVGLNFSRLAYLMYASLKKSKSALLSNKNPALLVLCHTYIRARKHRTHGTHSALRWTVTKIVPVVTDAVWQRRTIKEVSSIKQKSECVCPFLHTTHITHIQTTNRGETMQNDVQTLTEKQLLTELVQELRCNTEAVENLQSIAANIYDLQKEAMWDRSPAW